MDQDGNGWEDHVRHLVRSAEAIRPGKILRKSIINRQNQQRNIGNLIHELISVAGLHHQGRAGEPDGPILRFEIVSRVL